MMAKIISKTHRATVAKSNLRERIEEFEGMGGITLQLESATEIAARLRACQPPKRAMVWIESIDGYRSR